MNLCYLNRGWLTPLVSGFFASKNGSNGNATYTRKRFQSTDERLNAMDDRFNNLDKKIDQNRIEAKEDSQKLREEFHEGLDKIRKEVADGFASIKDALGLKKEDKSQ